MSDPKHDDALPRSIREALKQVHEPPATPREDLWRRIQAERQARQVVRGNFGVPRALRLLVAAAAVLLMGFLMGRLWEDRAPTPLQPTRTVMAPADTASGTAGPTEVATDSQAGTTPSALRPDRQQPAPALLSQAQLYHAANHFSRSGVLLAQFAETARDEDPMDPALHQWARDLLTNTRLLLDSPLAADPQYRKLLRDLEFTLAQIVQASTDEEKEERQWVAGHLGDRSLVERLRLVVPALPGTRDL